MTKIIPSGISISGFAVWHTLIPALAVDSDRSQGETLRLAAELSQNVVQTFGFTRVLLQADDGQAAEIRICSLRIPIRAGWSCSVTF